jgi:hypothetical protein
MVMAHGTEADGHPSRPQSQGPDTLDSEQVLRRVNEEGGREKMRPWSSTGGTITPATCTLG